MKEFFTKALDAVKAFFKKAWALSMAHKAVAITVASTVVVGTTCAIVLPIALHNHKFAEAWTADATNHWHVATCKHDDEKSNLAAHTYDNACDKTCNVCGYERVVGQHVFNQEVAEAAYLHTAATATTKGIYYKSCACGAKGAETFEVEKIVATITNIQNLSTQYTSERVTDPTFDTNSDGIATFSWYNSLGQLLPAAPTSVGMYTVKISIPETGNYLAVTEEREFVISKRVLTIPAYLEKEYDGYNTLSFTIDSSNSGTGKEVVVEVKFVDFSAEPVGIKNAGTYDETDGTFQINLIREDGVSSSNYELDLTNADFEVEIAKKVISNKVFTLTSKNAGTINFTIMYFHGHGILEGDKLDFNIYLESDVLTPGEEYDLTINQSASGPGGPYYVEINNASAGLDNYDIDWSTIKVKRVMPTSFASAIVLDCKSEYSDAMNVAAGQVIYLKVMAEEGTMNNFDFKATTGSAATFDYKVYYVNDTSSAIGSFDNQASIYQSAKDNADVYYVITVKTAGVISIVVSN